MRLRVSHLAAALAFACAGSANAGLVGSTYDFSTSVIDGAQIEASPDGSYTDPANARFCVLPWEDEPCHSGNGLFGSFSFADVNSTLATITFVLHGATDPVLGSFSIKLGSFSGLGGATITGITYASGNLEIGDFTSVTWDGTTATFTGSPAPVPGWDPTVLFYDHDGEVGGGDRVIVFNVALRTAAVPEPSSLALLGIALLGLGAARRRFHRV